MTCALTKKENERVGPASDGPNELAEHELEPVARLDALDSRRLVFLFHVIGHPLLQIGQDFQHDVFVLAAEGAADPPLHGHEAALRAHVAPLGLDEGSEEGVKGGCQDGVGASRFVELSLDEDAVEFEQRLLDLVHEG